MGASWPTDGYAHLGTTPNHSARTCLALPMARRPPSVPAPLTEIAERQHGLVSLDQCVEHGVSRQQAAEHVRRGTWSRPARGVYDLRRPPGPAIHPYDHERRRAAILGLLARPGSIATGVCALVLHGVQGAPRTIAPEVTFPDGSPRRPKDGIGQRRIRQSRWVDVGGFRCAPVVDAIAQALPTQKWFDAVALLDSARHLGKLTDDDVRIARDLARGYRGWRRADAWWDQSDPRAESPAETWARLSCGQLGFPPDAVQLPVALGPSAPVARVDLAWRLPDDAALLVEIDGRDEHSLPEAVLADRRRQNRIDTRRTVVRRFTGREAARGRVGAEVARELILTGWRPRTLEAGVVLRLDDDGAAWT